MQTRMEALPSPQHEIGAGAVCQVLHEPDLIRSDQITPIDVALYDQSHAGTSPPTPESKIYIFMCIYMIMLNIGAASYSFISSGTLSISPSPPFRPCGADISGSHSGMKPISALSWNTYSILCSVHGALCRM